MQPLKPVIRIATAEDNEEGSQEQRRKKKKLLSICLGEDPQSMVWR